MDVNTVKLGGAGYRISIDRKIQKKLARQKRANMRDPVFETMNYFAQKFSKSKSTQKELVSVLAYFILRYWGHTGAVLKRMEEDFNYIVVRLMHKKIKHDKAVQLAALIFRALMLMRMHKFAEAHAFDMHLKKELRKVKFNPIIRYLPELEIDEEFEIKKVFK